MNIIDLPDQDGNHILKYRFRVGGSNRSITEIEQLCSEICQNHHDFFVVHSMWSDHNTLFYPILCCFRHKSSYDGIVMKFAIDHTLIEGYRYIVILDTEETSIFVLAPRLNSLNVKWCWFRRHGYYILGFTSEEDRVLGAMVI